MGPSYGVALFFGGDYAEKAERAGNRAGWLPAIPHASGNLRYMRGRAGDPAFTDAASWVVLCGALPGL
jgi:hypothetical protein